PNPSGHSMQGFWMQGFWIDPTDKSGGLKQGKFFFLSTTQSGACIQLGIWSNSRLFQRNNAARSQTTCSL
ncbi:MAG: hypothetical protein AB1589_06115, partial [Cyanobacteriota bacterium]